MAEGEKINRFFVVVCFQGVESSTSLDCNITKQRAKGPTGRRLPRQVQSRLFPGPGAAATSAEDGEKRSESLPRLEMDQSLQRLNRKHSTVNNMGMSMTTSTAVSTSNQLINRLIRLEEGAPPPHPDPSQSNLHDNSDDDNFDSTWFLSVNPTPPIAATSTTSELRTVSTGSNTSTKTRRRRSKLIICAANSNDQTNSTNNRSCQFL